MCKTDILLANGPSANLMASRWPNAGNVDWHDDLSRLLAQGIGTDRPSACKWAGNVIGQKGFELFIQNQSFRFYLLHVSRGLISACPPLKERLFHSVFMTLKFGALAYGGNIGGRIRIAAMSVTGTLRP